MSCSTPFVTLNVGAFSIHAFISAVGYFGTDCTQQGKTRNSVIGQQIKKIKIKKSDEKKNGKRIFFDPKLLNCWKAVKIKPRVFLSGFSYQASDNSSFTKQNLMNFG